MRSETLGISCVILSALALSTMGVIGSLAFNYNVDPINLVTLRASLAFSVLVIVMSRN